MVENVKVLAEAIQEVLVEGTISSGRRDKLVDIYAKLQRNLNLTGGTQPGNSSLLSAFYGPTNNTLMSVAMFKDLLQHGSSQPDSTSSSFSLAPATSDSARSDRALLAARDFDLRESGRGALGYQDVDHRRMDARCNPARGFEKMVQSGPPASSLASPRCPSTGQSDAARGSHSLPMATTGRGFQIDPNATFMDIDERNKCSKDIDERGAWGRTTTEREPTAPIPPTNVIKGPADLVHKSDSLWQGIPGIETSKTVLAQGRTAEYSNTPSISGSPRSDAAKTVEKTEVPKSKEVLRQEAVASRIEDELQLLEMLVTIQCELGEVEPVPKAPNETPEADVAGPTPVPEQALDTSGNIPSGVSSVVSKTPTPCATVSSPVADDVSQESTTQSNTSMAMPQQKVDEVRTLSFISFLTYHSEELCFGFY